MSWRDNPEIIWQDEDGDRLECWGDLLAYNHPSDEDKMSGLIHAPETAAEWDELLHRLAAAAGRRIVGIEDAPRPIEVGDIVTVHGERLRVLHMDDGDVTVRDLDTGVAYLRPIEVLSPIEVLNTVPEPEPAPEPTVCTEDHRLCAHRTDWCKDSDPESGWYCSRPFGHDGLHVACTPGSRASKYHSHASWGGDL